MLNVDTAKIPILLSASIPDNFERMPMSEKSKIPWIRKPRHPSSRSIVFQERHLFHIQEKFLHLFYRWSKISYSNLYHQCFSLYIQLATALIYLIPANYSPPKIQICLSQNHTTKTIYWKDGGKNDIVIFRCVMIAGKMVKPGTGGDSSQHDFIFQAIHHTLHRIQKGECVSWEN